MGEPGDGYGVYIQMRIDATPYFRGEESFVVEAWDWVGGDHLQERNLPELNAKAQAAAKKFCAEIKDIYKE